MRADASIRGGELRLAVHDVEDELRDTVVELAFAPDGAAFVRTFPAGAPYAEAAARRFVSCADRLVRQCARLEPVPCVRIADALADLLVEPLAGGGYLGEWWLRAFAGARIECVGGVHASVEPADFGPVAASRLEAVTWRGHNLRVPPLDLQLQVSERRGLDDRVRMIRELLA